MDYDLQDFAKRLLILEKEVMHLKKTIQYKSQKRSKTKK